MYSVNLHFISAHLSLGDGSHTALAEKKVLDELRTGTYAWRGIIHLDKSTVS